MSKPTLTESEALMLQQRIAAVEGRAEKTREAARFLFFFCGQYPSAALVRSYTQTGSLSDISEDLRLFWESVRDSGRSQLKAPLPDVLVEGFGQQLGQLWKMAAAEASKTFDGERQSFADEMKSARDALTESKDAAQALAEELALVRTERDNLIQSHRQEREKLIETNQELTGQLHALTSQVQVWQEKTSSLEQQLEQAQATFSHDLEKLAAERDKERESLQSQHRFTLLQIDSSRAAERDLREQLKYLRETQDNLVQSYRVKAYKADQALAEAQTEIRILSERIKNLTGNGVPTKPKSSPVRGVRKTLKKRTIAF